MEREKSCSDVQASKQWLYVPRHLGNTNRDRDPSPQSGSSYCDAKASGRLFKENYRQTQEDKVVCSIFLLHSHKRSCKNTLISSSAFFVSGVPPTGKKTNPCAAPKNLHRLVDVNYDVMQ